MGAGEFAQQGVCLGAAEGGLRNMHSKGVAGRGHSLERLGALEVLHSRGHAVTGCGGSRRQYAQQNGGGGSERGAHSRGQLGGSVGAPSKGGGVLEAAQWHPGLCRGPDSRNGGGEGSLQTKQGTRDLPSAPARG